MTANNFYFAYDFKNKARIVIAQKNSYIAAVSLMPVGGCYVQKETELIKRTKMQLEEYFAGKRKNFDLPLAAEGTDFQKKVWNALLEIPYGKTVSYGELAKKLGKPKAARAVGGACNKNPICIIVPCHRVIGANGNLTGYAFGLDFKRKLLQLEKAI